MSEGNLFRLTLHWGWLTQLATTQSLSVSTRRHCDCVEQ